MEQFIGQMKKKILLFEGIDGSGKTSLLREVSFGLGKKGVSNKIISRNITPAATLISQGFIGLNIPPETEVFLRIAREYINAGEITKSKEDVFLLDRSLITIQAISKIHGLDEKVYSNILANIYKSEIFTTGVVFCTLPFQIAKQRVYERLITIENTELKSIEEMQEHECDNNVYNALHDAYEKSDFPNKLEINTFDFNLKECTKMVLKFIEKI